MFWKKRKARPKQMFSLTSDCQRDAFRINTKGGMWVKITDKFIPVIDISINGFSFQYEKLKEGDNINVTIQLGGSLLIEVEIEVIHLSSQPIDLVCGCLFRDISVADRELINSFILQEQKKQIKAIAPEILYNKLK